LIHCHGSSGAEREPERVGSATLVAHFTMTRQNVARLTAEGILGRTSAGYLMDDSRRRYIRHLREEYRTVSRPVRLPMLIYSVIRRGYSK
jgi:hypothetical protein